MVTKYGKTHISNHIFCFLFSAVPLTALHPPEMLKYFVTDSTSSVLVCGPDFEKTLRPIAQELSKPLLVYTAPKDVPKKSDDRFSDETLSNDFYGQTEAMLIYTSGKIFLI